MKDFNFTFVLITLIAAIASIVFVLAGQKSSAEVVALLYGLYMGGQGVKWWLNSSNTFF